jgi:hypothetical protein
MREKLFALVIVGMAGLVLIASAAATIATLVRVAPTSAGGAGLTKRAVDHVYGASVVVEYPGGKGVYFRFCDPEGYLVLTNGFDANSTLTVVRDERCEGVR